MSGVVTDVVLGVVEVATSSIVGASICAPVPPLALLMIPACALSSLTSVASSALAKRALDLDDCDTGAKFGIKSVSLLIGTAVASAVCIAVLFPISVGAAAIVSSVIAVASIVGAVVAVIIDEAPSVYPYGYNSYSVNIGTGSSYPYSSSSSVFRSHSPSYGGSSARGFGLSGVPARGFDCDRR